MFWLKTRLLSKIANTLALLCDDNVLNEEFVLEAEHIHWLIDKSERYQKNPFTLCERCRCVCISAHLEGEDTPFAYEQRGTEGYWGTRCYPCSETTWDCKTKEEIEL